MQFEDSIADQSKALQAKDSQAYVAHAEHALDLIDRLEKLYA